MIKNTLRDIECIRLKLLAVLADIKFIQERLDRIENRHKSRDAHDK